jgi:2-C-methyl-D-erythritol 2,4-cyclodiphosphate synthase
MIRTGTGFDVHRFCEGRPLILGGVDIPHSQGLRGHSDADVLSHALSDALLGAVAAGDLGHHFPDTDARWLGADSLALLSEVCRIVRGRGATLHHVDATVMAEQPKLAGHILAMRQRLAEAMELELNQVSVKATTTEGLGFTGRGEGIAAMAVATVDWPQQAAGSFDKDDK